jgi:phage shock protein A
MTRDSETFTANATRCREEADSATLDNVRDRCLRAEAAWSAMASRSRRSEKARDERVATAV